MKKILLLVLFSMILLSGCSSNTIAQDNTTSQTNLPSDPNSQDTLQPNMELAIGTIKLDGTQNEISLEQATELLFLWKAFKSLSNSDITAQEELDAVFTQIQEIMTSTQLQAIEEMQLTGLDMRTVMKELGMDIRGGNFGEMNPEQQATVQALRESGQFPGGGFGEGRPPEGGMGPRDFMPGAEPNFNNQRNSEDSGSSQPPFSNRFGTASLDAIIQYLESKIK